MPFIQTSRKITLVNGVLSAECKKHDGRYVNAAISLDDYLGNIDGKFTWGAKGFSITAQDAVILDGVLTAKLKTSANKLVDSKIDLNHYINNNNGVLESANVASHSNGTPKKLENINVTQAQEMVRAGSISSTQLGSASSSSFSATSTTSATAVSSTFSSSHFKSESKQLLIEESCTLLILEGAVLKAQCRRMDGSIVSSSINLDLYIGNGNGHLEWDLIAFSKTCIELALDGYFLTARCLHYGSEKTYSFSRLDLRTRLRNADGILICIELNKRLSTMLTEVPWMKFKVIAEPDLSLFSSHPVVQETLVKIAESTVEHVTTEMHKKLTIAMQEAVAVVTASAMHYAHAQISTIVQDAVGVAGAHGSMSESIHFGLKYDHSHHHHHHYGRGGSNGHGHVNGNGVGLNYGFGSIHNGEHGHSYSEAVASGQHTHTQGIVHAVGSAVGSAAHASGHSIGGAISAMVGHAAQLPKQLPSVHKVVGEV